MGIFSSWFRDQIAVSPWLSDDSEGVPAFGARVLALGRIEDGALVIRGVAVDNTTRNRIATEHPIKERDRVWISPQSNPPTEGRRFPAGYAFPDGDARSARNVRSASGLSGISGHVELDL